AYKTSSHVNENMELMSTCRSPCRSFAWWYPFCFALLIQALTHYIPCLISICRTVTPSAAMGIIAPRDFADVILVKKYEDGTISSNGVLCEGFNHQCGCFCVPISEEPNKTQVLSFFQADLGGFLYRSMVDSFFPSISKKSILRAENASF
uniref:Uncharacterized protein n=1 Tax=Mola mola TaxID=94237 RepID=A0A3Q4BJR1_MOLML